GTIPSTPAEPFHIMFPHGHKRVSATHFATYRYFHVPKDIFEGFRDASSQGRYMRDMIIDMYQYEQK
ncbi:MAG: KTSC domain-containing protein, partial [Chloroflexota bacterium]